MPALALIQYGIRIPNSGRDDGSYNRENILELSGLRQMNYLLEAHPPDIVTQEQRKL